MEVTNKPKFPANYDGLDIEEVAFAEFENCYGQKQEYKLDILRKQNDNELRPVVIFVHGGGFIQPLDKRQNYVSLICRQIIEYGYTVISPDYPLYNDKEDRLKDDSNALTKQIPHSIKAVYDFILKNADKYNFDTSKIAIIGGSAGATTAYNAIATYKELKFTCFGALWGVPAILPDISHFPPIFSVHGTNDSSYVRQVDVTEAFSKAHISCTLISVGGSGHSPIDKMAEYVPPLIHFLNYYTK